MTKVDFFGHFFYFFLFLGMLLIQYKDYRGWAFRFAGEAGWIGIGLIMGMSSIWAWGFAFMVVDVLGFLKWQKEDEIRELMKAPLDDLYADVANEWELNVNSPNPEFRYWSGTVKNDTPTFTEEKKDAKPLRRRVRKQATKQVGKAKAKAKRNPAPKRKSQGKKVATRSSKATNRKVRPARGRSGK